MNRNRKTIAFVILVCGILIGFIISARFDLSPLANSQSKEAKVALIEPGDFTEAIEKVASTVGPTVVSIHTESTRKYTMRRRPSGGPFQDEFFDQFFKDFFGDLPDYEKKLQGLGTGVIIDGDGYILTNEHVVADADKINVTLADGREFEGTLTGTDPRSDLAIIHIDADNLPVAALGNSDEIKTGQWVVALGYPFGQLLPNPEPTVTVGVISALQRSLPRTTTEDRNYSDLIQTDAAINPGNSGGPLVNLRGEVVGINVAIFSTSGGYQGIGFAIPIDIANRILNKLIKGKKIEYGWIGVTVQNIDQRLADYFGLPDTNGVVIMSVLYDGPAQKAGLKDGDVILEVNGKAVKNVTALINEVGLTSVGKKTMIKVHRNKKKIDIPIVIDKRPTFDELGQVTEESEEEEEAEEADTWRGIHFQNIPSALAKRLRLENNDGVMIAQVDEDSSAQEAGLRKGDIITSVNTKAIKSVDGFKAAVKGVRGDCLLKTNRGYIVVKKNGA